PSPTRADHDLTVMIGAFGERFRRDQFALRCRRRWSAIAMPDDAVDLGHGWQPCGLSRNRSRPPVAATIGRGRRRAVSPGWLGGLEIGRRRLVVALDDALGGLSGPVLGRCGQHLAGCAQGFLQAAEVVYGADEPPLGS